MSVVSHLPRTEPASSLIGRRPVLAFPLASQLQRPVLETVTPLVLQKVVWAGANLGSFPQSSAALKELAGIELFLNQVHRMTEQVGQDRLDERQQQVADFKERTLMEKSKSPVEVKSPNLGMVMFDGGRDQRRDHFGEADYDGPHWKEDKVALVLSVQSKVHESDPHPQFPEWLASAEVVREIASLEAIDEVNPTLSEDDQKSGEPADSPSSWHQLTPTLLPRELLARSECRSDFGHHLQSIAY